MSIESLLERIAVALENKPTATSPAEPVPTPEPEPTPTPEPETDLSVPVVTMDDVINAAKKLLPDRRDYLVKLLEELGEEKVGDIKPEQYQEAIDKFNTASHS